MPPELRAWVDHYEAEDPFSWIVETDPDEVERIAQLRMRKGGGRSLRFNESNPLAIDRLGAMGECACRNRLGLSLPDVVDGGSDRGVDFRVGFERWVESKQQNEQCIVTLDVKTRANPQDDLLLVSTDKLTKDSAKWLILAKRIDETHVRLMGWDDKFILSLHRPQVMARGYHPSFARPVHQLRPMFQLEYLLGLQS